MAQWQLLIVELCAGEALATNACRHFSEPELHTRFCAQNVSNKDVCVCRVEPAGRAAVTAVERFVRVGVVSIEVQPISPFSVDHMDLNGNMSPLIYSQLAVWHASSDIIGNSPFSPGFDCSGKSMHINMFNMPNLS